MMAKINLTQGYEATVDDEDMAKLAPYKWHIVLTPYSNYARAGVWDKARKNNIGIMMHRMVLGLPRSRRPVVDHINHDGLDNRKANLRICNMRQNMGNVKMWKHNTSGHRGVYWSKATKKWHATLAINSIPKFIGYSEDKMEAVRMYQEAAKKHFGEFYVEPV